MKFHSRFILPALNELPDHAIKQRRNLLLCLSLALLLIVFRVQVCSLVFWATTLKGLDTRNVLIALMAVGGYQAIQYGFSVASSWAKSIGTRRQNALRHRRNDLRANEKIEELAMAISQRRARFGDQTNTDTNALHKLVYDEVERQFEDLKTTALEREELIDAARSLAMDIVFPLSLALITLYLAINNLDTTNSHTTCATPRIEVIDITPRLETPENSAAQ